MKNWAISILLALPVALASHGLISILVSLLDPNGDRFGEYLVYAILAIQVIVLAVSAVHISKFQTVWRKIESIMIWSGYLLVATIPLLLGVVALEAFKDTSSGGDGAAAAFFMLVIIGGAYGGVGLIVLIAGLAQRRSRRAIERPAKR